MPETRSLAVADLQLDLTNFRTVRQETEGDAVMAMVATSPDRFWALTESLLVSGYLPTENILVLQGIEVQPSLTVKEGNRRTAALKLIHGLVDRGHIPIPANIERDIVGLSDEWVQENARVPCVVYRSSDSATVDRIVTLAHGKGEKAGRDQCRDTARQDEAPV